MLTKTDNPAFISFNDSLSVGPVLVESIYEAGMI